MELNEVVKFSVAYECNGALDQFSVCSRDADTFDVGVASVQVAELQGDRCCGSPCVEEFYELTFVEYHVTLDAPASLLDVICMTSHR